MKDKTNEELIELLEERDQTISDLRDELKSDAADVRDYDKAILEVESIAEKSFYNGYKFGKDAGLGHYTGNPYDSNLRAWLNYKIGEMI